MGERIINPIQNIHTSKKYKEVIFINPYRFGSAVSDTDAQAFILAAGITDTTQKTALNNLVTALKGAGVWTKMKAIYPFIGGSANSHKWNLKDPRDLDAAFRLVFNGSGWIHSESGAKPDPSLGCYAETYLTPSLALTQGSSHLSYYSTENITNGSTSDMGGEGSGSLFRLIIRRSDNSAFALYSNITAIDLRQYSISDARGLSVANILSNTISFVKNGSALTSTSTGSSGDAMSSNAVVICAVRRDGSVIENANKNCAFASIGDGLSTGEHTSFYNAVQAYQTTLGRQV